MEDQLLFVLEIQGHVICEEKTAEFNHRLNKIVIIAVNFNVNVNVNLFSSTQECCLFVY